MSDYDHLYKVLLIGDSGVGKSCILLRYTEGTFIESYISTVGVDFMMKTLRFGDKTIKLQLWDTAGQERFRTISSSYYRGAHGIVVVFDVCSQASFNNIDGWLKQIDMFAADSVSRMIVGTKIDCAGKRQVEKEIAEAFAKDRGLNYLEVSAQTGENIEHVFLRMTEQVHAKQTSNPRRSKVYTKSVDLNKSQSKMQSQGSCAC
jgi:Ras-related protein Rab-1A